MKKKGPRAATVPARASASTAIAPSTHGQRRRRRLGVVLLRVDFGGISR
jgi:hypothetical protein